MRRIIGLRPSRPPPPLHPLLSAVPVFPDQTATGKIGESRLRDRDDVAADGAGTIADGRRCQL